MHAKILIFLSESTPILACSRDEIHQFNSNFIIYCFQVKLSGSVSSVYLNSLLMASPLALGDIEIDIVERLVSSPFVEMTLKVMENFGVTVQHSDILD